MKAKKGFTIIEVTIALSILIIALVYLVSFFPTGLNLAVSSKNKTVATFLAQAKLEEIISQPYIDVTTGQTTENSLSIIDEDFSVFSRETNVIYLDGSLNQSVSDLGLKKITVTVSWYDDVYDQMDSTSLATLIID